MPQTTGVQEANDRRSLVQYPGIIIQTHLPAHGVGGHVGRRRPDMGQQELQAYVKDRTHRERAGGAR